MLPTQWEDPVMSLSTITSPSQYSLGPMLSRCFGPPSEERIDRIHLADVPQVPHRDHQRAGHHARYGLPRKVQRVVLGQDELLRIRIQDVALVGQFIDDVLPVHVKCHARRAFNTFISMFRGCP